MSHIALQGSVSRGARDQLQNFAESVHPFLLRPFVHKRPKGKLRARLWFEVGEHIFQKRHRVVAETRIFMWSPIIWIGILDRQAQPAVGADLAPSVLVVIVAGLALPLSELGKGHTNPAEKFHDIWNELLALRHELDDLLALQFAFEISSPLMKPRGLLALRQLLEGNDLLRGVRVGSGGGHTRGTRVAQGSVEKARENIAGCSDLGCVDNACLQTTMTFHE